MAFCGQSLLLSHKQTYKYSLFGESQSYFHIHIFAVLNVDTQMLMFILGD